MLQWKKVRSDAPDEIDNNIFSVFVLILFRAIFDLSNKIPLLILLRMYALSVEKKAIW